MGNTYLSMRSRRTPRCRSHAHVVLMPRRYGEFAENTYQVTFNVAGTTTLLLNLARCLLDGGEFLDTFAARPLDGRVALVHVAVPGRR